MPGLTQPCHAWDEEQEITCRRAYHRHNATHDGPQKGSNLAVAAPGCHQTLLHASSRPIKDHSLGLSCNDLHTGSRMSADACLRALLPLLPVGCRSSHDCIFRGCRDNLHAGSCEIAGACRCQLLLLLLLTVRCAKYRSKALERVLLWLQRLVLSGGMHMSLLVQWGRVNPSSLLLDPSSRCRCQTLAWAGKCCHISLKRLRVHPGQPCAVRKLPGTLILARLTTWTSQFAAPLTSAMYAHAGPAMLHPGIFWNNVTMTPAMHAHACPTLLAPWIESIAAGTVAADAGSGQDDQVLGGWLRSRIAAAAWVVVMTALAAHWEVLLHPVHAGFRTGLSRL